MWDCFPLEDYVKIPTSTNVTLITSSNHVTSLKYFRF